MAKAAMYAKSFRGAAKIGEAWQLSQSAAAPAIAASKVAICLAIVSFLVACAALGVAITR